MSTLEAARAEVSRVLSDTASEQDFDRLVQCVSDSGACCESRRTRQRCDCFCCAVVTELQARGWETHRMRTGSLQYKEAMALARTKRICAQEA